MKNENGKITITVGMLVGVIVLLLIIIVCLTVYTVKIDKNNTKISEQNSYTDLAENIGDENEEINSDKKDNTNTKISEQNSYTNSVENISGEDKKNNTNNDKKVEKNNTNCSIDTAKMAIEKYLQFAGRFSGCPEGVLDYFGYTNYFVENDNGDGAYMETNIKYTEFENKVFDIMTKEYFAKSFEEAYKNQNNILYVINGGGSGMEYDVKSVDIKNNQENTFIAHVDGWVDEDYKETQDIEFQVAKNEKNNYVIDNIITQEKNSENEDKIIGKWYTYKILNQDAKEMDFKELFGSGYSKYGSSLELKADNTFIDNIYPIQSSENSNEGTYKILRNYYKTGDCYIELTYSNKKTVMAQVVYYDETGIESLSINDEVYHYDLKK